MLFSRTCLLLCNWLHSYVSLRKNSANKLQICRRSLGYGICIIIIIYGIQRNRISIPGDIDVHTASSSMGTGKGFFFKL